MVVVDECVRFAAARLEYPWAAPPTSRILLGMRTRRSRADVEDRRRRGQLFDEVADLYDRMRPSYPDELFRDLAAIAGLDDRSAVLEVGCGTGQATAGLAALRCGVTCIEPGSAMVELARRRLADAPKVSVEQSSFEAWDDAGRRYDALMAASSWHWVDPTVGWPRSHELLRPGGWVALAGHVVVRRPGELEVYAETADLHDEFAPGNPDWGNPPLEDEVRATDTGWGEVAGPGDLFGPTIVRWYPTTQVLTGAGFADLLRTTSLYRRLEPAIREPLLDAVAERIRTRLDDRATRRYLAVLRLGQRID